MRPSEPVTKRHVAAAQQPACSPASSVIPSANREHSPAPEGTVLLLLPDCTVRLLPSCAYVTAADVIREYPGHTLGLYNDPNRHTLPLHQALSHRVTYSLRSLPPRIALPQDSDLELHAHWGPGSAQPKQQQGPLLTRCKSAKLEKISEGGVWDASPTTTTSMGPGSGRKQQRRFWRPWKVAAKAPACPGSAVATSAPSLSTCTGSCASPCSSCSSPGFSPAMAAHKGMAGWDGGPILPLSPPFSGPHGPFNPKHGLSPGAQAAWKTPGKRSPNVVGLTRRQSLPWNVWQKNLEEMT